MKVRINNNQPNAAQRKALRAECVKEFDKLLADYNRQVALQVLYILRFDFGFGQERLRRFSEKMKEIQPQLEKLQKKYQNKTSEEEQRKQAEEMMIL